MTPSFRFIVPGERIDGAAIVAQVGAERLDLVRVVWDTLGLADSAALFFRGCFPSEAPFSPANELLDLPWSVQYWEWSEDGSSWPSKEIFDECERMAAHLSQVAHDTAEDERWWSITGFSERLSTSKMLVMQGYAVEALMGVDRFLLAVSNGNLSEALVWNAAAYRNIIECTCQAQKILGFASENARKAAHARHRESREMKEEVWRWYAVNRTKYRSMDKAAEAVVGPLRLVPVSFRTVRGWIGEWVKNQRSARKP